MPGCIREKSGAVVKVVCTTALMCRTEVGLGLRLVAIVVGLDLRLRFPNVERNYMSDSRRIDIRFASYELTIVMLLL